MLHASQLVGHAARLLYFDSVIHTAMFQISGSVSGIIIFNYSITSFKTAID